MSPFNLILVAVCLSLSVGLFIERRKASRLQSKLETERVFSDKASRELGFMITQFQECFELLNKKK